MARSALLLLLGLAWGASAALPPWYKCDCSARDNCMCPGTAPPGGLAPKDTPQFILFTHDDAIVEVTDRAFRDVCDGRLNPDGCPFRATMFTQQANTDCQLARRMHEDGYEIASHTANHIAMPAGFPYNESVAEILGAKRFLSEECGIPADEIRGFRSPYLRTNPAVRRVLHEHGFLYDSTLLETKDSESISTSMANRTWPYTMDFGIAQNCDWFSDTQLCEESERWPGLWEVPLWVLSVLDLEFAMDVGYYGGRGVYEPLMAAFEASYSGNRAPLPIFVHTTWVEKDPSRVEQLQRFADFTRTKGDVYWVTMSQLIEWMKDPVPASQLKASGRAMCKRPAPPPPAPPLPPTGVNVSLSLAATPTQVADQRGRLEAAVARLLLGESAAGAAGGPFVAEVAAAAAAAGSAPAAGAGGSSGPGGSLATQEEAQQPGGTAGSQAGTEGSTGASSSSSGAAGQALLAGLLQFEGPSYASYTIASSSAPPASAVSALSMPSAGPASQVKVMLAVGAPDPLALYQQASIPSRRAALAGELSAMGLQPVGEPTVVPIKDGVAMTLPSPPTDSSAATPAAPQLPAPDQPAANEGAAPAQQGALAPPDAATPVAGAGTEGAPSTSTDESGSGSSSSGLHAGAIAGIACGAAALLAAAAWLVYRRQQRCRAAEDAASAVAGTGPGAAGTAMGGMAEKEGTPAGSVSISVSAVA